MHEEIAKWKGNKQVRKTDVECRKATWNPRQKTTVTLRCRAENVQLGKGYACGTAVARRRMVTKGKFDWQHAWGWRITARRQGESISNYPTRFNNINNKLMHPQFNAESPDQAQWPKIQINLIDGRSSQPSNSLRNLTSPDQPKESDHTWKACPGTWTLSCCNARSWSVSIKVEKGCFHGW